jgi:hypothetical protein
MKAHPSLGLLSVTLARAALALTCLCLTSAASQAAGKAEEATPEKPKVEQLDENRFRVGDVILDQKTREVSFPALVNMREGLLEFLVVHEHGAVHEALFSTKCSPTDINVALTLLRFKPSKELYRIPERPGGRLSDKFHDVPEETRLAARIGVFVDYEKDGAKARVPVSEWIRNDRVKKVMPPTHWVYGGSEFYRGKFVPETTGEIAAIFITNTALLNYAGTDNLDDEVWIVMTAQVPEIETKVTLVFAPYEEP